MYCKLPMWFRISLVLSPYVFYSSAVTYVKIGGHKLNMHQLKYTRLISRSYHTLSTSSTEPSGIMGK